MTLKPHKYPRATYSVDITDTASLVVLSTMALDAERRPIYSWVLRDGSGTPVGHGTDIYGAVGERFNAQRALGSMLSFMGAAAEAYASSSAGRESDNGNLFPPAMMEFCSQYSDEISILQLELEQELEGLGI